MDGRADDAKTISLRLCRGITGDVEQHSCNMQGVGGTFDLQT